MQRLSGDRRRSPCHRPAGRRGVVRGHDQCFTDSLESPSPAHSRISAMGRIASSAAGLELHRPAVRPAVWLRFAHPRGGRDEAAGAFGVTVLDASRGARLIRPFDLGRAVAGDPGCWCGCAVTPICLSSSRRPVNPMATVRPVALTAAHGLRCPRPRPRPRHRRRDGHQRAF